MCNSSSSPMNISCKKYAKSFLPLLITKVTSLPATTTWQSLMRCSFISWVWRWMVVLMNPLQTSTCEFQYQLLTGYAFWNLWRNEGRQHINWWTRIMQRLSYFILQLSTDSFKASNWWLCLVKQKHDITHWDMCGEWKCQSWHYQSLDKWNLVWSHSRG